MIVLTLSMLVRLTYSCFNVVNVGRYWHKVVLMYRKSLVPLPCPPSWERMAHHAPPPLGPSPLGPPLLGACYRLVRPPPLGSPSSRKGLTTAPLSLKKTG